MVKLLKGVVLFFLLIVCSQSFSQKNEKKKFGDVKPSDFLPTVYGIDSSANAVVLFDIGSSAYEGDTKGGFSIIYKRHIRIRLLNKNAFDLATVKLRIYADPFNEEKIEKLEANTYVMENGKMETYKLDKASIFKDKLDKNWVMKKFTLPNLKEGCIIDINYTLNSPNERYLRPWYFQSGYPVLWSQYEVVIPSIYDFVVSSNGTNVYATDSAETGNETYYILIPGVTPTERSEYLSFRTTTTIHTWAMKEVKAIKEEDFMSTTDNYISKIDFQLSKIKYPNSPERMVKQNWKAASEDLLKDEDFGDGLSRNNGWMQDDLKNATKTATTALEKAKKIYEYIRDNFTCTDYDTKWLSAPLKKIFQNKSGNVADINLLLTAALSSQGFHAKPALLSTRSNGKANELYPIMSQLNYVICNVQIDGKSYCLDAAHSKLGFAKLESECYNGSARVIDKDLPKIIELSADSSLEYKITNAFFTNDPKDGFSGVVTTRFGNNESYAIRKKLANSSQEDYLKNLKTGYGSDIIVSEQTIEGLKEYETPLEIKFNAKMEMDADIIYLNPIFAEGYKENPFKSADRKYPVEMPYLMNENYILRMEIPKGYKVDEVPKSTRVNLNENEGLFEYLVSKDAEIIQLRSTIKLNKANFDTEDYESLRNFYAYIVKKHGEQIVLKKIK